MSIRPSQPQREENPFPGFLLHLAPCLTSSRSSILGVWGHQPNKPLWIQKVCQCRQNAPPEGCGEAGPSPGCDTGRRAGADPVWTPDFRTQDEACLEVTGLAAGLTSRHRGGGWVSPICFFPVPVRMPGFSPRAPTQQLGPTTSLTTPRQASHTEPVHGKERFIHEKSRVLSSEFRAADLSALCRGLPALGLYFSKMEQTAQGSWMKILRRSYSSCFFAPSQVSRVLTTAPRRQGHKQVSRSSAHGPAQEVNGQRADQREQQLCGSTFTSIRVTLQI